MRCAPSRIPSPESRIPTWNSLCSVLLMISSCNASAHGDSTLVGDKGYRRFLEDRSAHSTIDDPKVEADV